MFTCQDLESNTAFRAAEEVLKAELGDPSYGDAWGDLYFELIRAVMEDLEPKA